VHSAKFVELASRQVSLLVLLLWPAHYSFIIIVIISFML